MSSSLLDRSPVDELPEWIKSDTLYEVIDGEFVEKLPMSADASRMATRLARLINNHTFETLGEATIETLLELPGSTRLRRPDLMYVSYLRWPKGKACSGAAWNVVPELCVEVVSPTDRYDDVMEKTAEYFAGGVAQVWIMTPSRRIVQVYSSLTRSRGYQAGESIDAGSIIPGFHFDLSEVL